MIKTLAPPEAIISRISRSVGRYGEKEYLVDRQRLHRVEPIPLLRDDWWLEFLLLGGENHGEEDEDDEPFVIQ